MKQINAILADLTKEKLKTDSEYQVNLKMLREQLKKVNYSLIERELDNTVYLKHENGAKIETHWTILDGFNVAQISKL